MKSTVISAIALFVASTTLAVPTKDKYAPEGGWDTIDWTSIKYPPGTGENLPKYPPPKGGWENVKYPPGTGENLPKYPPPKGGWENVKYPPGTGENLPKYPPAKGGWDDDKYPDPDKDYYFTSSYHVTATPGQVVNDTTPTGGLKGAKGYYSLFLNSNKNLICYHITLTGFRGKYESAANTATHIHEAKRGKSGLPRIAFPNPKKVGKGDKRVSKGCMKGPFRTGLPDEETGVDTGKGFTVKEIEMNPKMFYADVHSSLAVPGAVRGQLA